MTYFLYPLEKEILKERLKHELDLRRVFRKRIDLTPTIQQEVDQRVNDPKRENWIIVQINGETGSIKSGSGIAFALQYLDPNFAAANVTAEYTDFINKLDHSERKQAFILDEMVFQRGIGSMRFRESIINLSETLRKRQNSMIFITPTEKFISDENVTFTLEPCGFDKKNKVMRLLVKKKRYLGFFYLDLKPIWNKKIWKEYSIMKDDFIERSKSQQYKKFDYEQQAQKMIKDMGDQYKKSRKTISLYVEKNMSNVTKEERDLLIQQIIIFLDEN